ncbi:hypothetical protein JCM8097_008370 [Rhodosporidiobolus ruineniae]
MTKRTAPDSPSPVKKQRRSASPAGVGSDSKDGLLAGELAGRGRWKDWPAPRTQMEEAKAWIRECVETKQRVLLVPDKDADGLSSGLILSLALRALSHPADLISVYHLPRGINIHAAQAQEEMLASFPSSGGPTRAIVLDQGSRPGPPLLPPEKTKVLILDHHLSDTFPEHSTVLSACHSLPVATTSILTYCLACELVPALAAESSPAGMAALLGVYGDLGSNKPNFSSSDEPWPSRLAAIEKRLTKSALGKAVALLNAPRRTPQFNVADAYAAIEDAAKEGGEGVKGILKDARLLEAKERTSAETSRWQGAPPTFSKDGSIAVIKVDSGYQIHPVIATRWCGTLRKAKTLVCVMCANTGYTPGYVHFSCRAPRRSSSDDSSSPPVDLIAFLRSLRPACNALAPGWSARVGEDFARGHREATGGIIPVEEFDVLMRAVELGVKKDKAEGAKAAGGAKKVIDPGQKTTLDGFFKVSPKKEKAGTAAERKEEK